MGRGIILTKDNLIKKKRKETFIVTSVSKMRSYYFVFQYHFAKSIWRIVKIAIRLDDLKNMYG